MKINLFWIFIFLIAASPLMFSACEDSGTTPTIDAGTADTITDTQNDSDTIYIPDSGPDTGTGSVADTVADTISSSDQNSDSATDSGTDSGSHTGLETDTTEDTSEDTSLDTNKDTSSSDTNSIPDTGSHASTDVDTDTGTGSDTGLPVSEMTVEITAPDNGVLIEAGKNLTLKGTAQDSHWGEDLLVAVWRSDVSGVLGTLAPGADGNIELPLANLSLGWHVITLEVENPSGQRAVDAVMVGSCAWSQPETFDEDIKGWKIYKDAYWDPGGWLEMTGIDPSKKGMIFRTSSTVDPGDVSISFSIHTGGGINSGADGFAMSVYNAQDVAELETILSAAGIGGCLGYAVDEGCGSPADMQVEAFHIEIDTWMNNKPGNIMQDPTSSNHIGVMLNGNASDHVLWANTPSIEDQKWHDVTVDITGIHVTVTLDGAVIIDGDVPELDFRGGYIGFSGTTGWASNWHSFDNLHVQQGCVVPL